MLGLRTGFCAAVVAVIAGGGCVPDDSGDIAPDGKASKPDGGEAGDRPDACPGGLNLEETEEGGDACPGELDEAPEGGEIRLETREFEPYGAKAIHAAEAVFFEDQEPGRRELLGEPLSGGDDYADGTRCWDKRPINTWNGGARSGSQEVYETRSYLGAGDEVRLVPFEAGRDHVVLPKVNGQGGPEVFDVTSRAQGLNHAFLYQTPAHPLEDYRYQHDDGQVFELETGALYEPRLGDGAELPELSEATEGWSVLDDRDLEGELALYMPARFDMVSPAEEAFTGHPERSENPPVFAIAKGANFVFELGNGEASEPRPERAPTASVFLAVNGQDGLDFYCLQSDPTANQITLPAEAIDEIDEANVVFVGRLSLAVWTFDKRRLNVVGAISKVGTYCVDEEGTEPGSADSCAAEG